MTGINKVTPSKAIRPVKPGNKGKNRGKSNKQDEQLIPKDTNMGTDTPTKHIDERI